MSLALRQIEDDWNEAAPLGPQLVRSLRGRIVRTEFAPGMRLSEQEIAQSYGLSRQPVREAFIRLAEEGFLEIRPQRGTFVRRIAEDAVMDARFMREAIEADLVRAVAIAPERAVIDELKRLVARQSATAEGDAHAFIPLDEAFHRSIAEATGRFRVWAVLQQIKTQLDRVRYLSAAEFPKARLIAQHAAIVAAIESGDADAAEAAMRRHLRKILDDLPAIVAAHPAFFETRRSAAV